MKRIRKSKHTQIFDFTSLEGITKGVHYENGFAIATNGGRMFCMIKDNYPNEWEGRTIDIYGNEIEGDFPNWRKMLTLAKEANNNSPRTFIADNDKMVDYYSEMKKATKDMECLLENYFIVCDEVYFNATEFKPVYDMMVSKGMTELNVSPYDINGTRPTFACNQNGLILIMPTHNQDNILFTKRIEYGLTHVIKFNPNL